MARSAKSDFTFKERIGSGSYGTVWKAVRNIDKKVYAIKELDLRCMKRKEQEETIKEVEILAVVDSPFIIHYYDSFLEDGRLYIVTEFASGGTLHDLIQDRGVPLPEENVWKLLIQIVLGLHHMHSKRILHRDIKSMNVFLDTDLHVKIGDLGVSKLLSSQTSHAKTMIGTPYYLSPELCEEKPYNEKSDVWSLGVVIYECCTGKHPFEANSQGALILKILRGKYAAVRGYSSELTDVVKRCLTQAAARRPDTARLLGLPAVRNKAKQLGIELPEPPAVPSPMRRVPLRSSSRNSIGSSSGGLGSKSPRAPVPRLSSGSGAAAAVGSPPPRAVRPRPAPAAHNGASPRGQIFKSGAEPVQPATPPKLTVRAAPVVRDRPMSARSRAVAFVVQRREADAGLEDAALQHEGSPMSPPTFEEREPGRAAQDVASLPDTPSSDSAFSTPAASRTPSASRPRSSLGRPASASGASSSTEDAVGPPRRVSSREGSAGGTAAAAAAGMGQLALGEEEGTYDAEEVDDMQSASLRASGLRQKMTAHRARCEQMVGTKSADLLYALLKAQVESDMSAEEAEPGADDDSATERLSQKVFEIIPFEQAEALHLIYQVLYLESQLAMLE